MLLQQLRKYASIQMEDLPPKLYKETPVRYVISLDEEGRLLSPTPIDLADPSSPRTRRGLRREMPQVVRASGIVPLLFADNCECTLGLARETSKPERVAACHSAYLELVRRCAEDTGHAAVGAVLRYLQDEPLTRLELPPDFDSGGTTTFQLNGSYVTDLMEVQLFWAAEHDAAAAGAPVMQCLVCGEERPVLDRLQAKLKGIPGGQTSGTSIISANVAAFESYGLEASLIAPTCADCGESFTLAANELLARPEHSRRLGGSVFIWWTRVPTQFDFMNALFDPTEDFVGAVFDELQRPRTGRAAAGIDANRFYGTALSASGGRTVVRDWIDISVAEAVDAVSRWFLRQRIVDSNGQTARPLGIPALAGATVRELRDVPPPAFRSLLRAALHGTPVPWDLMATALRRTHAEQGVTRNQAALIKLVLLSQDPSIPEDFMAGLEPEHPDIAYHCGRLLAILEDVQRAALPGINATIVDRFYGSASTAPAGVFPRLLRGAQPHLSRLERDRPGAHHALQRRMEEVLDRIPAAFPSHAFCHYASRASSASAITTSVRTNVLNGSRLLSAGAPAPPHRTTLRRLKSQLHPRRNQRHDHPNTSNRHRPHQAP